MKMHQFTLTQTLQCLSLVLRSNSSDNSTANVGLKGVTSVLTKVNSSSDLLEYGSLRVPTAFDGDLLDHVSQQEVAPELPLVLMFKNESIEANKFATLHQLENHEENVSESTDTSSTASPRDPGSWSGGVSLPITALSDNQISLSSGETIPTTAGSVVLENVEPELHAQLTALLQTHTESSKLPQHELQSTTSVTNRIPVRNKGQSNKRPRPKPSTASIKNVEITSTTQTVESAITKITNSVDETNSAVTESLADQQANLLQFLVSNPPAWVLDEIINGSTLTTWYPLPISGKFSQFHYSLPISRSISNVRK